MGNFLKLNTEILYSQVHIPGNNFAKPETSTDS